MIKQPGAVRDLVVSDVDHMSRHLHATLTMRDPTEHDALTALEDPQRQGFIVDVANFVLARFGHVTQPSEPRYDKARRALAKKTPKGPRGEPKPKRNGDESPPVALNGSQSVS